MAASPPSPVPAVAAGLDRLATSIENARVLDPVADALAGVLRPLMPRGAARDLLSGTAAGHPLHPMLVSVPIGSWLGASWLDATAGRSGRAAARRLVALGVLAAAPTALSGSSDWLHTQGAERRVGLVHAAGNDLALGLYVASWQARRQGRHTRGVALALAGAGLLGLSGWLGGHLTYALGVGVDTTAFTGLPADWTAVGRLDELPDGEPAVRDIDGTAVLLLRRGERVTALGDRCTHRGGPLHEGTVEDGCVVCPWHGSAFLADGSAAEGAVRRGPATRPQERLEARVVDGRVDVRRQATERSLRGG